MRFKFVFLLLSHFQNLQINYFNRDLTRDYIQIILIELLYQKVLLEDKI